jgi:hypothetical protein
VLPALLVVELSRWRAGRCDGRGPLLRSACSSGLVGPSRASLAGMSLLSASTSSGTAASPREWWRSVRTAAEPAVEGRRLLRAARGGRGGVLGKSGSAASRPVSLLLVPLLLAPKPSGAAPGEPSAESGVLGMCGDDAPPEEQCERAGEAKGGGVMGPAGAP